MRGGQRSGRLFVIGFGLAMAISQFASEAAAEDPPFVPWTALLPGFSTGYDPSSANDCTAGKLNCVNAVIKEMERRF